MSNFYSYQIIYCYAINALNKPTNKHFLSEKANNSNSCKRIWCFLTRQMSSDDEKRLGNVETERLSE